MTFRGIISLSLLENENGECCIDQNYILFHYNKSIIWILSFPSISSERLKVMIWQHLFYTDSQGILWIWILIFNLTQRYFIKKAIILHYVHKAQHYNWNERVSLQTVQNQSELDSTHRNCLQRIKSFLLEFRYH